MDVPYKAWLRFYFKLSLSAAWNGFLKFLWVLTGAGALQVTQTVNLTSIGLQGAFYLLLSTIVVNIAADLYKHPLPAPEVPKNTP